MQCETKGCSSNAVFHITWVDSRHCKQEQHFCEEHAHQVLTNHDYSIPVGSGTPAFAAGARSFDIDVLIITEAYDQQCVYLHEVGGRRFVPIFIGIFEAAALDRHLKGFESPRPLTHDAMADLIDALHGHLEDVVLSRLEDNCYFTDVRIRQNGELVSVDMRPSDAIILAVIEN